MGIQNCIVNIQKKLSGLEQQSQTKLLLNSQKQRFIPSKIEYLKIYKPLNTLKVRMVYTGDPYFNGLLVDLDVYRVLKKYTRLLVFKPVVYGRNNALHGYIIAPLHHLHEREALVDLDINDQDRIGRGNKIIQYKADVLSKAPNIVNRIIQYQDGSENVSLSSILFHESIAQEIVDGTGVKMEPISIV